MSNRIEVIHPLRVSNIRAEAPLKATAVSLDAVGEFLDNLHPQEEMIALGALLILLERRHKHLQELASNEGVELDETFISLISQLKEASAIY